MYVCVKHRKREREGKRSRREGKRGSGRGREGEGERVKERDIVKNAADVYFSLPQT
jgi:hypothetical protein